MANRKIFSKHIKSNVKLATRYDAEGREVQVERREDSDALAKEQETFDILIKAGYYRACIKGLSSFDKVVGGMTWCIECCDYDVDVDLLFHENLTIGQKINLVEKIVAVLPQMKCPYQIEPHQIQGLEFLSIYLVIQWLVKTSVANRSERILRLKNFAVGQFYNNFQFQSDRQYLERIRTSSSNIKHIQETYQPKRLFQHKELYKEVDEISRVQLTISEYGVKNIGKDTVSPFTERGTNLEKSLTINNKQWNNAITCSPTLTSETLNTHYQDFKREIETDVKQLNEQRQIKALEATRLALEKKMQKNAKDNEELLKKITLEEEKLQINEDKLEELKKEIAVCKNIEDKTDEILLTKIKTLLAKHDQLKKEENQYKDKCRSNLKELEENIEELERFNLQNPEEQEIEIQTLKEKAQKIKLQLAKSNRAVVIIERQLDNIPDRTELAQYQRRFHELYNEMDAKHHETKQYFSFYNTLNDKKCYMEKELSLLDSICEAYSNSMSGSRESREEFLKEMEVILNGVQQTSNKIRAKYNKERCRHDQLIAKLQTFIDVQREYNAAIKQFTKECQRSEKLRQQLTKLRLAKKV